MADSEKTLRGADGLRTLACLMVVFHHLSQELVFNRSIQAPEALRAVAEFFTSAGSSGVSVFFVLSGFLLAIPFWRAFLDGKQLPDLRVYAARRAARIMPGFYLNLLFFFVLSILFNPEAPALIWRYFAGLTFTSGFHWLTFFPVEGNGPLWSIGFEVVSYVLLPIGMGLLFVVLRKTRTIAAGLAWWAGVWVVVFAVNQALQSLVPEDLGKGWQYGLSGGAKFWMPRYNPLGFFGHFALGTFAAGAAVWWSRSEHKQSRWFDAASLVLTLAWVYVLVSRSNQDLFSWNLQGQPYYFPLFAGLTAALLACLTQSDVMGRVFDNRFSRYTAQISFGLYLWHTFIIGRFNGAIADTGEWLMLVVLTLAGSYLIATLSWKRFEEPILRRVQAWKPGASAAPTRFPLFVGASAAVLVLVPLLLTALVRPTAWTLPTTAGLAFVFNQPGAVTGLTGDGKGGWYATFRGTEIHHISADKTYRIIYTLAEPADLRLNYERPRKNPLAAPEPGLIVLKAEKPYLWNLHRGPDGNLFVAAGDRVLALSPEGRELRTEFFPRASTLGVVDVAVGDGGDLYVPSGAQVLRVGPRGERSVFLEDASLVRAAGIAFNAAGTKLFLSDFDPLKAEACRILAFPVSGGEIAGPPAVSPAKGALFPVASGEEVYFSQAFTGWLYRWNGATPPQSLWAANLRSIGALATGTGLPGLFAAGWDGTIGQIAPGGTP